MMQINHIVTTPVSLEVFKVMKVELLGKSGGWYETTPR
jgi:hypothetical protein